MWCEYEEDFGEDVVHQDSLPESSIYISIENEMKKAKIQEMVNNIPNSINNNKDNLEVVTIAKLKERYNNKTLLTAKIVSRIINLNDIPQYSHLNSVPVWLLTARELSSVLVSTTSTSTA